VTAALLAEQVVNGLMVGAIYALFAIGLALMLSVMDIVNTAHGELFMLGAYAALGAPWGSASAHGSIFPSRRWRGSFSGS
jgi:branched-subunit amino acid ABC-type transport system permease component